MKNVSIRNFIATQNGNIVPLMVSDCVIAIVSNHLLPDYIYHAIKSTNSMNAKLFAQYYKVILRGQIVTRNNLRSPTRKTVRNILV